MLFVCRSKFDQFKTQKCRVKLHMIATMEEMKRIVKGTISTQKGHLIGNHSRYRLWLWIQRKKKITCNIRCTNLSKLCQDHTLMLYVRQLIYFLCSHLAMRGLDQIHFEPIRDIVEKIILRKMITVESNNTYKLSKAKCKSMKKILWTGNTMLIWIIHNRCKKTRNYSPLMIRYQQPDMLQL